MFEYDEIYGLPHHVERVYVGISNDLRRRFDEHLSDNEPNLELRTAFATQRQRWFWFRSMSIEQARVLEPKLIHRLQPRANRLYRRSARKGRRHNGQTTQVRLASLGARRRSRRTDSTGLDRV